MTPKPSERLGAYFRSRREKGKAGLPTMSVTLDRGLVLRDSIERKMETNLAPDEHLRVYPGDIAYNMMRMWQGASGMAETEGVVSPAYVVLAPKPNVDPLFASYLFKTSEMIHRFWAFSYGLTDDRLRLYPRDFTLIPASLPPLPEQQKIAEILSTWDKAIETTEALLANARTQKRALMQSLLTGTRRFPGFEDHPWREVRLDQLVDVNPSLNVCPVDGNLTFLPMDAVSEEAEIVAPRSGSYFTDLKGFTAFKDGDVLVAKITPCFENGKGCHARNLVNGVGTGSTEFHVLRPKIETDVRFIFHLVNSHPFRERGRLNMQGSAGQQRVPSDYIRLFRWTVPSSPYEREAIGAAIDGATVEMEHVKRQLDHLRTEKKSLMQQLLTGKRRVVPHE